MNVLKIKNLVGAASVSGWNICLWGNPKLTVYCGNCGGPFKTRDYVCMRDHNNQIAVFCPHCHFYNLTGLYEQES